MLNLTYAYGLKIFLSIGCKILYCLKVVVFFLKVFYRISHISQSQSGDIFIHLNIYINNFNLILLNICITCLWFFIQNLQYF